MFRGPMPTDNAATPPAQQALALGEALRTLRERGGMTQEQAGEAMGVTRQAWQQYETAGKPVILRTDMQERLAAAIGLHRDDLIRERDRLAGRPDEAAPQSTARIYEMPVLGRVRAGATGPQLYDLAEQDGVVDLGWLFGPNARTLRVAGDMMTGYVESGQFVIYDTALWPRRGDGCVVELATGEVHVAEYAGMDQGVLKLRQRLPDQSLTFPMSDVRGVYTVRFRGA